MRYDGLNRSCPQDGVAGVAQGRKECERKYRAEQPNGAYCVRLWYVPRCFWTAVPDFEAEHMGGMFENARKPALSNYQSILRNIHEKPSIIAQTHNPSAENRPVVALRALYLCLQCPSIMTEADRDQHFETKSHCFCRLRHDKWQEAWLTRMQRSSHEGAMCTAPTAKTSYMTPNWRSEGCRKVSANIRLSSFPN
jgi:hypothetical protein